MAEDKERLLARIVRRNLQGDKGKYHRWLRDNAAILLDRDPEDIEIDPEKYPETGISHKIFAQALEESFRALEEMG